MYVKRMDSNVAHWGHSNDGDTYSTGLVEVVVGQRIHVVVDTPDQRVGTGTVVVAEYHMAYLSWQRNLSFLLRPFPSTESNLQIDPSSACSSAVVALDGHVQLGQIEMQPLDFLDSYSIAELGDMIVVLDTHSIHTVVVGAWRRKVVVTLKMDYFHRVAVVEASWQKSQSCCLQIVVASSFHVRILAVVAHASFHVHILLAGFEKSSTLVETKTTILVEIKTTRMLVEILKLR